MSVTSPSSESSQPFVHGYGRARGNGVARGRGRPYNYDEHYHRPQVRSRSPEPNFPRRTQPSATPPPQVPAFGSTGASVSESPVPGVSVPTAPRFYAGRGAPGSLYVPAKSIVPQSIENPPLDNRSDTQVVATPEHKFDEVARVDKKRRQRKPLFGRRPPKIQISDDYSDSDLDPFNDDDPEDEINFESELAEVRRSMNDARNRPDLPPLDQFFLVNSFRDLPLLLDTKEVPNTLTESIGSETANDMSYAVTEGRNKSVSELEPHLEPQKEPDVVLDPTKDMSSADSKPFIGEDHQSPASPFLKSPVPAATIDSSVNQNHQRHLSQPPATDQIKSAVPSEEPQSPPTAVIKDSNSTTDVITNDSITKEAASTPAIHPAPLPTERSQSPSEEESRTPTKPTETNVDIPHSTVTKADAESSKDRSTNESFSKAGVFEETSPKDDASKDTAPSVIQPATIEPTDSQPSTIEPSLLPRTDLENNTSNNDIQDIPSVELQHAGANISSSERPPSPSSSRDYSERVLEPLDDKRVVGTSTDIAPPVSDEASGLAAEKDRKSEIKPVYKFPLSLGTIDTEILPDAQAPEDDSSISPRTQAPIQRPMDKDADGDHQMEGTETLENNESVNQEVVDDIGNSGEDVRRIRKEQDGHYDFGPQKMSSPVPQAPELTMEIPEESDDDEDEAEQAGFQLLRQKLVQQEAALEEDRQSKILDAVKHPRDTKTPPPESLPMYDYNKWDEDPEFLSSLEIAPDADPSLTRFMEEKMAQKWRRQQEEGKLWADNYAKYRTFTDMDLDPIAVRSREAFAKAQDREAEESVERGKSVNGSDPKTEGQRRTGSRFATEHDIERVLRESEREAKESKEQQEQDAREETANSKEASIPDMCWDDEYKETMFVDTTHKVPFERSFRMLEFGESIDNFTEEEARIFREKYSHSGKQFSVIAESLPHRDYKACIQHYYIIKTTDEWKAIFKKKNNQVKTGRRKGAKKSSVLITNIENGGGNDTDATPDVENGNERRRPRRAAAPTWNFEAPPPTDNEGASPAPTPAKRVATPKGDANGDSAPSKRKVKVPREKIPKQPKASQLLAAAPSPAARNDESPNPPPSTAAPEPTPIRPPVAPARFPPYDSIVPQQLLAFSPPFMTPERLTPANLEVPIAPERVGSAPPTTVESQPDRRSGAQQQTSSYWSVPEVHDFPELLRHFGTDWQGIAKHMGTKTHTMVKNYYQRSVDSGSKKEWETITRDADSKRERGECTGPAPTPSAPTKRRYDPTPAPLSRSASAMDLDELSANQPITLSQTSPPQPTLSNRFPALAQAGPVPQSMNQTITPSSLPSKRSHHQANQHSLSQIPQQQQPISASPSTTASQIQPQPQQIQNQQVRQPRGPAMGFFTTDNQRPTLQSNLSQQSQTASPISDPTTLASQRSARVAEEAHRERQKALEHEVERMSQEQQQAIKRLALQDQARREQQAIREQAIREQAIREREQALREQQAMREQTHREQQQAFQRREQIREMEAIERQQQQQRERESKQEQLERNLKRKQERDHEQREQREQQDRKEKREQRNFQMKQEEIDVRNPQQYELYSAHSSRTGSMAPTRPEVPYPAVTATEIRRQAPSLAPNQQYPRSQGVRNLLSDGMSVAPNLIPSPSPAFGRSGIVTPPIQEQYSTPPPPPAAVAAMRQQDTPRKTSNIMSLLNDESSEPSRAPPIAQVQPKRVGGAGAIPIQNSQTPPPQRSLQTSRFSSHSSQQSQQISQQIQQNQQMQQAQHQISSQTNPQHGYSQPSSQSMHQHSSSVGRSYTPTPYEGRSHAPPPTVQHHQMYSQPSRQTIGSQSSSIRREPLNEINAPSGYTRSPITKLNESPYSATPPPASQQMARQTMSSPHDLPQASDRDIYNRQSQFAVPQQANTPVDFHSAPQVAASHRSMAFGQSGQSGHRTPPAPRGQWIQGHQVSHHVHNSRQNSFDARNYNAAPSTSVSGQQGYAQAPSHHMQYQQQQNQERFDHHYERERERERQEREREQQYYRSRDDQRDPRR
ncbi:hypothetical protein BCON_0312g00030 [Botryotinia convoluta]|uniref:SANT domain-containing protein n=1 Tax=Botryotinia convoluta TaxID=54673 RepID=A0A4Z1HNX5_9HELO|nr:hypothetical protein BCON_0312g00030 [Botryotinia convoluta]